MTLWNKEENGSRLVLLAKCNNSDINVDFLFIFFFVGIIM